MRKNTMRRCGVFLFALALAAACDSENNVPAGPSTTGPIIFTAQLSAANETPPITGPEAGARGAVTITFNVPRDNAGVPSGPGDATFAMQLSNFPPGTPAVAAHIHIGAAGVPGAIVVGTTLAPTAPVLMGDGTANVSVPSVAGALSQALAAQITANPAGYYFNVHTALNPGGAVRGQLVRVQ
jgi:CHRD domain